MADGNEISMAWHGIQTHFYVTYTWILKLWGRDYYFLEIPPGFVGFGVWRNVLLYSFSFLWILDFWIRITELMNDFMTTG